MLALDPWTSAATQRRTCYCTGVHFPHKVGLVLNLHEICEQATERQILEKLGDAARIDDPGAPGPDVPF